MTTFSRVEKARLSKREKRIKLTRTGAISTLALGLAGCVQGSAAAAFKVPEPVNQAGVETLQVKQATPVVKKESPHYLYSMYENDDLNQEVKVYGFKNTTEEPKSKPIWTDKTEYTKNNIAKSEQQDLYDTTTVSTGDIQEVEAPTAIHINKEQLASAPTDLKKAEPKKEINQKETAAVDEDDQAVEQQEVESKEILSEENNGLEDEQTKSNEEETAVEEQDESVDQEQPQAVVKWNNHGKVLHVEGNRFALETEDGPKWFVNNSEEALDKIEPGMAVSVYFVVDGEENQITNYFITYTPNKGDLTEFVEAHFLNYASEEKRAIVVYIPHQEIIFDLAPQMHNRDLEQEFENGAAIILNTVKQEDGSVLVKSISTTN